MLKIMLIRRREGENAVERLNRSYSHVWPEEEARREEETREYLDGIASKRHTKPSRKAGGNEAEEEYVETEYYKDLNCVDKKHHTFFDGFLDLVLIKDCPRYALASILLKTGNGSHVKSPYGMNLKCFQVKAFWLLSGNHVGNFAKGGIVDVDGEVIARGRVYTCGEERDPMSYGPPILVTVVKGFMKLGEKHPFQLPNFLFSTS